MERIIYVLGNVIMLVFRLAFVVGISLVLLYVIFNMIYNARFFRKLPTFLKNFIYTTINFTRVWGPKSLILYIFGQIAMSLGRLLGLV